MGWVIKTKITERAEKSAIRKALADRDLRLAKTLLTKYVHDHDSDAESHSAVPFLSDIPVLGELFKHETHQRDRRSLIVFLTPSVVHSSADQEILLQQELKRRKADLKEQLDDLMTADFHTVVTEPPK